jgi:5-formyltetrahydrofolate cyclo-ligase
MKTDLFKQTYYHIYLSNSLNNEVETDEVIKLLFKKNKRVYVPKIMGENLIHIEINKTQHILKTILVLENPQAQTHLIQ